MELAFKVAAGELKVSVWGGCLSTAWLGAEDGAALAIPSVRHGPFNLNSQVSKWGGGDSSRARLGKWGKEGSTRWH